MYSRTVRVRLLKPRAVVQRVMDIRVLGSCPSHGDVPINMLTNCDRLYLSHSKTYGFTVCPLDIYITICSLYTGPRCIVIGVISPPCREKRSRSLMYKHTYSI